MLKKTFLNYIFIFVVFILIYLFLHVSISFISTKNKENIIVNVELEGETNTYRLRLGSTFNDLKEIIDNNGYDFSLIDDNYRLFNGELIKLNKVNYEEKISINDNNTDNLTKLPGIGKKTAIKIIEYRKLYGDFERIEEIKNVSGIGDKKYEKIKDYITI